MRKYSDYPNQIVKNIIFAILIFISFFTIAELLCRFLYTPGKNIFEYDKDKIYKLKSNIKDGRFAGKLVQTNSFGYRDSEIPVTKTGNTVRILVVGDSVTFGHGVDAEDTYSKCLERRLNEEIKLYRFEVINTAVPGNSPFQEYYDLKRGLIFKPDIVVVQFVSNDLVEPYKAFRRYGGRGIDYHNIDDACWLHNFLMDKSALYVFLDTVAKKIRYGSLTNADLKRKAVKEEVDLGWNAAADIPKDENVHKAWQECLKWMQKEVDLCRANGISCILLVTPVDFQLADKSRTYAQRILQDFALQNKIEFLDLLPSLRR
ncbi:MAG: GDSL-type esterase/lipase family protein, partial [Candidatus Omnitrophica bacterium]|nr:GDSL-type esterase/lipase family protein [Candidatus Omnitrophota bacterium]